MLSPCVLRRCLMRLAVTSATELAESSGTQSGADPQLWIDDTAAAQEAHAMHVASPEYRELHRPALTNSAMGLYGGEPGFEKAYRVWVDPDRPHMKHIYNQTALAKNLRYSRYGYFKRDMHLLDVDKLIRHARMLPTPNRLLNDFLYQRVPLPDKSCAAFIRYQRDQMLMLDEWKRPASLQCAEEMFEQMAVTNMPPTEVGVETHAEMIRCCALGRSWHKGWAVYLNRAREVEEEAGGDGFVLDTNLFDAVLELCVKTERPAEGMEIMEEAIARQLRARANMLEKVMVLASIGIEQTCAHAGTVGSDADADAEAGVPAARGSEAYYTQCGLDAWALLDFYELRRTTTTMEAYLRLCGVLGRPQLALDAVRLADAGEIRLSLSCYYWLLYAVRGVEDFGDFIMDVFAQLHPRGLSPDYVLFTVAFIYCAVQRDGVLAVALYSQYLVHTDVNPTPEMVLLFLQACVASAEPQLEMLECSEALLERLESVGSSEDRIVEIYDQYVELCAHLGAVGSAFSKIKTLVSFGKLLTTRLLNSLLLANANATAPIGSMSMTCEISDLFQHLQIPPNDDTVICLGLCVESHGSTAAISDWGALLTAAQAAAPGGSLGSDADTPVLEVGPHHLRQLHTSWELRPRDMALHRYGQHTKPAPKLNTGSMLGSVVPFGRSPGERTL